MHGGHCVAQCQYLEVYREKIGDLLDTSKKNLSVREHPVGVCRWSRSLRAFEQRVS